MLEGVNVLTRLAMAKIDVGKLAPQTGLLELSQKSVRMMAQAGVSLEIWAQSKWGIRFATIDQVHVAPKPQYDPNVPVAESQMYHRVKSSIDLLVQFK